MFLNQDYLLFTTFFFFFLNEAKVGVRSREGAPAEHPGARGGLRRRQGPRGEVGRPAGGMSPRDRNRGFFSPGCFSLLGRASTGCARGLSLVVTESIGFKSIKRSCSRFLRASTAWPVVFKMHLIPHSCFAGIPVHETRLPLSTEQLLSFFPEAVFFLNVGRHSPFPPCDFPPQRNDRNHLQPLKSAQPHGQSPRRLPLPLAFAAAEVTRTDITSSSAAGGHGSGRFREVRVAEQGAGGAGAPGGRQGPPRELAAAPPSLCHGGPRPPEPPSRFPVPANPAVQTSAAGSLLQTLRTGLKYARY